MANISTGIHGDANTFNLKEIPLASVRPEVRDMLLEDETMIQSFQTIRDQVIFTDKRVFVVNVQGITGKKVAYISYPYSRIQYFGIETAGMLDIDSELILAFSNGTHLQFDFQTQVDIHSICNHIARYVL